MEFIAPDTVEDILEVVAVSHTHINLLALEVYNGILPSVFETVLVGWDGVVGKNLGESVGASGVHQVGQELNILGSELLFILHVNVDKITLSDLSGDGVQFGVVVGYDWQNARKLVVDKIIVILSVVEGIKCEAIEESSFVLGLTNNEGDFGELSLHKKIFWSVG